MRTLTPALLALPLALAACGDDEGSDNGATREVSLSFAALVGDAPVDCDTTYSGLGTSDASAKVADARLFVSEIALRDADGTWVPVELETTDWQNSGAALLDFEDGTGACEDSGTAEMNGVVTGSVAEGTYDAVQFRVGLPFELNHVDATSAPAPFNVPGMFWVWQGGFKFLRVDWAVEGGEVARWNIHVGSTGCASDAPTIAPTSACSAPNTGVVTVEGVDIDADTLAIDLAALVAEVDLMGNIESTPPGCMSSPGEPADCGPVFAAVGLDFDTGACASECGDQTVFKTR